MLEYCRFKEVEPQLAKDRSGQGLAASVDVDLEDPPAALFVEREPDVERPRQADAIDPYPAAIAVADPHEGKCSAFGSNSYALTRFPSALDSWQLIECCSERPCLDSKHRPHLPRQTTQGSRDEEQEIT